MGSPVEFQMANTTQILSGYIRSPRYPQYVSHLARERSFDKWHLRETSLCAKLALAGFFYAGYDDLTICHYCGTTRSEWTLDDDPWVKHHDSPRKCFFVTTMRRSIDSPVKPIGATAETISVTSGRCRVCFERPIEIVFLPCGHTAVCEVCAGDMSVCALCRTSVNLQARVYLP